MRERDSLRITMADAGGFEDKDEKAFEKNTLRNQTSHGPLEKNAKKRIATVERIRKLSSGPPDIAQYDIVFGAFASATSGLVAIVEGIEVRK